MRRIVTRFLWEGQSFPGAGFELRGDMVRFCVKLVSAFAIMVGLVNSAAASAQSANVAGQLSEFGRLSKKEARSATASVSEQIKRAADAFVGMNHPIRRAMRESLFGGRPVSPNQETVNDAKARLYLYGGLTPQTLSALFRPGPNAVATCASVFAISEKWCEALMAAAARKSVAEIRRVNASKQRSMPGQTALSSASHTPAQAASAPSIATAPVPPATAHSSYASTPPAKGAVAAAAISPPSAAPATAYNPRAPGLSTAEQYKANRAKYLASFKERKAAANQANVPTQTARPSSASPSASVKSPVKPTSAAPSPSPQLTTDGAKSQPTAATATPVAEREEKAESLEDSEDGEKAAPKKQGESGKSNPALDPLITDLLADPLSKGNSGKK
jgi:hypothetical protein